MSKHATKSRIAMLQLVWFLSIAQVEPAEFICQIGDISSPKNSTVFDKYESQDDVLALVEESTAPQYNGDCTENYRVDYLKLALNWGPGGCAADFDCKNFKADFTIHGLWPQPGTPSSTTVCCTKEKFSYTSLSPLTADLKAHWTSLSRMGDEKFWFYEWNKHGRCAHKIKNLNTVFKYFDFALKSYKILRVKELLVANKFYPSNQNTYQAYKIAKLFEDHYGYRIQMICNPMRNNPRKILLTEIRFCLTRDLSMIDCYTSKNDCSGEIMLLAA